MTKDELDNLPPDAKKQISTLTSEINENNRLIKELLLMIKQLSGLNLAIVGGIIRVKPEEELKWIDGDRSINFNVEWFDRE